MSQERLQKGEFLLKAVPTNNNVADLMTKHLAAARVEELLAKLGVRRCARGLVVASLFTEVEANHFDARAVHVATVSLCARGHDADRWVRGTGARIGCASIRCCRDAATREFQEALSRYEGVSVATDVTDSGGSARRRLMLATLRDELRVVSWRRGLSTRGLKEDLIKRLLHGHGAQALTEEAATALLFVRRLLGSRPDGFALTDDGGAIRWIIEACREKSVHNDGRAVTSGFEAPVDEPFGKQPRCEGLQDASLGVRQGEK